MSQKDDDPLCNPGHQTHSHNVVSITHKPLGLLRSSFRAATLACFGLPAAGSTGRGLCGGFRQSDDGTTIAR